LLLLGFFFVCILFLAAAMSPLVRGAGPGEDLALRAHVEAGEFGPALDIARNAADPTVRDRRLSTIAAAQARVGTRGASLDTASYIQDDRIRSNLLDEIRTQPVRTWGASGGGTAADFTSLINLIKGTIAPISWDDVGGPGAADAFAGGVYVDTRGMMRKLSYDSGEHRLAEVHADSIRASDNRDVRVPSRLRKVSLPRLEKQVQMLWALGQEPDETMRVMAGLEKVKYLLVYPDSGDIVIAGPASDWRIDSEGRSVSTETGRPLLNLDDFVVVLRNAYEQNGRFGCSITPTQENLARTKAYLAESAKTPLKPGQRDRWLRQLRDQLGKQDIEVNGIDPGSHAARILVEADYRMKLVGMGLEDGTLGVKSYLASIPTPKDGAAPPPMDVLRWWFTLNYTGIQATESRDAFELLGPGVKVLSENELVTQLGERVHTGKSDELNQDFAHSFTSHFDLLAAKYPIYAELQNIFDLALAAALLRSEDLPGQVGWHMTYFGPASDNGNSVYQVPLASAPKQVETVINHRVIGGKHIVAGVSGGVAADTSKLVQPGSFKTDTYGLMQAERNASVPKNLARNAWWWD
jgi:hypothetical protein